MQRTKRVEQRKSCLSLRLAHKRERLLGTLRRAQARFKKSEPRHTARLVFTPSPDERSRGHRQLNGSCADGRVSRAVSSAREPLYRRHRFPPEVISYAVWLYFRFPLSLRMVEEMLAARGICVTYETVRQWGKKFGKAFADQIRQRAPARGDKWHMDGVSRTHF